MSPVQPPSHDEIEAVAPVIEVLLTLAKWIGGPAAAAWIAGRFLVKAGVRAGEEKRRYEELAEDVELLKAAQFITVPQHNDMQRICTANLEHTIDTKLNASMAAMRADMSTMNGNICKIMGSLGIQDDDGGRRRRRTDLGD